MRSSDKPVVILASLFLLIFGIFGLILWLIITVIVIAIPASNPKPVIRPAAHNTTPFDTLSRLKGELEAQALAESDPQVAAGIRRAAELLHAEIEKSTPVMMSEQIVIDGKTTVTVNSQSVTANTASVVSSQSLTPAAKPSEPLDQIVLMLYVGAFLLLGGMSLFIVYGGLADSFRLVLIATMALLMYAGGLLLFSTRQSLRPAGVAFLGIGLMMIPLTGYAAVYLMQADPHITWFITSVFGLTAYVYALLITKAEVVGYLVFLMWLSLAQSAVTLFGGTLQWFAWVSLVVAILTQLLLPYAKKYVGTELSFPFWLSSLLLVPFAVLVSWVQVSTGVMELWQLGVSLVLGGLYCLSARYSVRKLDGSIISSSAYGVNAHVFLLLGLLAVTYDVFFDNWLFGYVLLLLAVVHLVGWVVMRLRPKHTTEGMYEWLLFILTITLSYMSWIWLAEHAWLMVMAACVTVLICSIMTYESRRQESALFATLAVFAIPPFVTRATVGFDGNQDAAAVLAAGYLVAAVVFIIVRILVRSNRQISLFPVIGYATAAAVAWATAMSVGSEMFYVQAFILVSVLAIAVVASYKEGVPEIIALAQIVLFSIFYGGLEQYTSLSTQEVLTWAAVITAAISYIYSLITQEVRGKTLLLASIVTMVLAWATSASLTAEMWDVLSPCIGLWLAGLLYVEKTRLKGGTYFVLLPVFVSLLAIIQLLDVLAPDLHFLVYTHLWAAYGAFVWYTFSKNGAGKGSVDLAMYGTLCILTIPLVGSALSQGSYYSLLLLIQQSIVLTLGIFLQQRVLSTWAAVTMVGVVMYALRSFGYLQLVIIAVVLIGYALFRLLNQQEKP